jgi:hypothetical protein
MPTSGSAKVLTACQQDIIFMENRAFLYDFPVIDRCISESHVEHEDDIEIAPSGFLPVAFISNS